MGKAALRIVERPSFYTEEVELWAPDTAHNAHSLHYVILLPDSFPPELPAFFLRKYSRRGETVLDPFSGSGTSALEAALAGRVAYASDANPLCVKVTRAKLEPVDIPEVTLWLQALNLSRPIGLEQYRKIFSPFYDIDTFREIVNLRSRLNEQKDRTARFVELIALSLLHGHTAGYFSVFSFPQISLSSADQARMNDKRCQSPEYRAVVPRLLRKAAMAVRDGLPSILKQTAAYNRLAQADARDLSYVPSSSVDLVITGPPLPGGHDYTPDLWLKSWFAMVDTEQVAGRLFSGVELSSWREFMNEVLLELARVTKSSGRAVFDLREVKLGEQFICLDHELVSLVEDNLARYWEPECVLVHKNRSATLKDSLKERPEVRLRNSYRILVLRRR